MHGRYGEIFAVSKPVIGMVHIGALPGSPLHDEQAGLAGLTESEGRDPAALQAAEFMRIARLARGGQGR